MNLREEIRRDWHGLWQALVACGVNLSRSRAVAEDLASLAIVKMLRNEHRWDGRSLRAWGYAILRNSYIDLKKKESRMKSLEDFGKEDMPYQVPDKQGSCYEQALRNERVAAVKEALSGISEAQANAVSLCDLHGQSYDSISNALDVQTGTVRSRISRGRTALAIKLRRYV